MKNPAKALLIPALLTLATASVWAQSSPPPAAALGASKIAILNTQGALFGTAEGKQKLAEIQSQFSAKQADLENMRKNLEDLQNRLTNGARTLSDEERSRLERQGQHLQGQLQRKEQEYEADIKEAQQDAIENLSRKIGPVVTRYAQENGYQIVIDAQVCSIYCSPQLDVTQDIIRLYDLANPVKGAAPAPGRPAPTPAKPAGQSTPAPAKPKP